MHWSTIEHKRPKASVIDDKSVVKDWWKYIIGRLLIWYRTVHKLKVEYKQKKVVTLAPLASPEERRRKKEEKRKEREREKEKMREMHNTDRIEVTAETTVLSGREEALQKEVMRLDAEVEAMHTENSKMRHVVKGKSVSQSSMPPRLLQNRTSSIIA